MFFKIAILLVAWFAILVVSWEFCVFLSISMMPALVAYLVDIRPGKNTSTTVTCFNLAGVTIPSMKFVNGTYSLNINTALDMRIIALVYLFAAMGYFIVWLVPKITVIVVDYRNERRAIRIREKITELVEEWGPEVRK